MRWPRRPSSRCSPRAVKRRSNFGEPLDRKVVGPAGVPADGGFPCGPCLRGDVVRVVVETRGVVWQHQVEVRDVDVRLVPVDQRDPIRGHADVARVEVAVDHAPLSSGEPRPRCSASRDALGRHRAEVDPRPGLGVQELGRGPPARALGPAVRQSVQLVECVGDATPVGLRFGRSALHVGHHDQSFGEVPAVHGRDRHRHRHPCTVEVSQQVGLPREVGVAALAEPSDGEAPVDAHAPHLVDADSAGERFDTGDVVTPLIECLPSHGSY